MERDRVPKPLKSGVVGAEVKSVPGSEGVFRRAMGFVL